MKCVAKVCLRPIYRMAKALGQPLAWRLRVFLIQPVLADLHALPALGAQFQQQRDELATHLTELQTQVQQLTQLVGQVREHQNQLLHQLEGQQGVLRETDRMILALLKTAQLSLPAEPAEALPRIYRVCENQ